MSRDLLDQHPEVRHRLFALAFQLVPLIPYTAGVILALVGGLGAWLIDANGRSRVRRNLVPLMKGAGIGDLERAARRSYVHFALTLNETFRLNSLPQWLLSPRNLRVHDPHRALTTPVIGPAVIATVHVNWELLLAAGFHRGYMPQCRVLVRSSGDRRIDELFDRARAAIGARTVHLDGAPLASLRALREGRVLGIVADRDYSSSGVGVTIAGHPCLIPAGPAALAVQTGAPIIPVLLARRGARAFTLIVGRPLLHDPHRSKQAQLPELCQRLADTFTRFLCAVPSQWVAFHDAWPSASAKSAATSAAKTSASAGS